jgi:hypothetical protein
MDRESRKERQVAAYVARGRFKLLVLIGRGPHPRTFLHSLPKVGMASFDPQPNRLLALPPQVRACLTSYYSPAAERRGRF